MHAAAARARRVARTAWVVSAALAGCAGLAPASVFAAGRSFVAERSEAIESCVDDARIRFAPDDRRASLDEADSRAVIGALVARYPVAASDVASDRRIVLWRKPEAGWIYIAVLANPEKPDEACFTATFVAARFEMTAALTRKYFGVEV